MLVTILMSTYNGEKYIKEQIESIINQDMGFKNIRLIIRDDGSTDETLRILKDYKEKYQNIQIWQENNVGPAKSFWDLITKCPLDSEYYAFADQDDIWLSDKISTVVKNMENEIVPTLFFSNALYVDKYGNSLRRTTLNNPLFLSVVTLLAGMSVPGCTMALNRSAIEKIRKTKLKCIEMHDLSCILIIYLTGKVIFDQKVGIHYRQHENNVIGNSGTKDLTHYKKKFSQSMRLWFYRGENSATNQAQELLTNLSNEISVEDRKDLELLSDYKINLKSKVKLLVDRRIGRGSRGIKRSFRLRVLFNLF